MLTITALALAMIGLGGQPSDAAGLVKRWLKKNVAESQRLSNAEGPTLLHDPSIDATLPGIAFYSLHFREYPMQLVAPEPLKQRNVFAVQGKKEVRLLVMPKDLQAEFRRANIQPKKEAVLAWLHISQVFSQDGFFHFLAPSASLKREKSRWVATGVVAVEPKGGDKGQIAVTMTFQRGRGSYALMNIEEKNTVQPGVRPICQATKLLDPDPIVRKMAERDLLVMGVSAKGYLMEQRAKASPELREEIDRVWKRILRGDR